MFALKMKCPCCGTTAGPWWITRTEGVMCVACAAWVSGFFRLADAFFKLTSFYESPFLPRRAFESMSREMVPRWAPAALDNHSRMVN